MMIHNVFSFFEPSLIEHDLKYLRPWPDPHLRGTTWVGTLGQFE